MKGFCHTMETFFKKFKRVSALIAVTIIALLYITTLVLAVMNNSYTKRFFYASLFSSVFLPVMLYLMMWIAKMFRSYNPNLNQTHLKKSKADDLPSSHDHSSSDISESNN